jgi:hypothetical protein
VTNAKMRTLVVSSRGQSTGRTDLRNVRGTHMIPVFNDQGDIVNYRYEMRARTRDQVLERDNRFEHLLGASAGGIYDKETTPQQNRNVIQALKDQWKLDLKDRADSYVEISPNSKEPRLREIWQMLPDDTKAAVREIWESDRLLVRNDLLDITFGQRAYSLSEMFKKEPIDRGFMEKVFVAVVEGVLEHYALLRGKTKDQAGLYAKSAAVKIAKSERIWQDLVKEIKDTIVVKSVVVLLGNIFSNVTLLKLKGVSWKDMAYHHMVALKGASAHMRDSRALVRAQMQLDAGYYQGTSRKALEQEILRLKDAIARNPVTPLIEAGLMPTIVEDVVLDEDIYSYKSGVSAWLEEKTENVPSLVKNVFKTVYMAHDTPMYQGLSRMTQLSDFVARYTLYQHRVNDRKNPMKHDDAISEAGESFINYDIPMHRGLQYMDNMGFMMFSKFFLRIQRVLLKTARENPLRVLALALLDQYMDLGPIVLESSMVAKFGNNPLNGGALEILDIWDELPTVQAALGLVK